MTAKTNMLVTLSAGVFLAGSACAELTYTETAEPTGGWVISINGKNYAVGLNGKVKINGDAILPGATDNATESCPFRVRQSSGR